ncbi:hypothetical protein ZIOFF_004282 [Zingiber officinale]|uniref:CBF1-interacting co-repressor CIR N-terminal domain-containing protein n=1 Tax=Zingiber officinale TaxID=94328 RepID=A0A8J5LU39_ZINOF|nr:hypothetical protein ZIOFF_004282 [Zingiber officinale]
MALKFLNKKGWHTGSLRNIENVWKAEQKHEAEQRKLEELRKQIQDEREKDELRHLSEQGGFAPTSDIAVLGRQERLDFLYESGLAVGKGNSDGFKALQAPPAEASSASAAEASSSKAGVLGALFEDKPQSANDAWRKLHTDPLLLIRQREQEALARIKNNPIKMAMIKKSAEAEKDKKHNKEKQGKKRHKSHRHSKSKSEKHSSRHHSDSDDTRDDQEEKRRDGQTSMKNEEGKSKHGKWLSRNNSDAERKRNSDHLTSEYHPHKYAKSDRYSPRYTSGSRRQTESEEEDKQKHSLLEHQQEDRRRGDRHSSRVHSYSKYNHQDDSTRNHSAYEHHQPDSERGMEDKHREFNKLNELPGNNRRRGVPKMSEEEREARLREMQLDAELHEEQRSKRLKKAAEEDRAEATRSGFSRGKTFLDAAQKSIYGTEKGGSATIEESVRRRAHYSQGGSAAHESNAFRR